MLGLQTPPRQGSYKIGSTPSTAAESPLCESADDDFSVRRAISFGGSPGSPLRPSNSFRRAGSLGSTPTLLQKSNSIGSLWTVELKTLRQSGSYFEAVECLRRIRVLLTEVYRADRMKFCKADYDSATKALRKQKTVWSTSLFKEVVSITVDFFNTNSFNMLPTAVFVEILHFISVEEFLPIFSVSASWREVATCDEAWSSFYRQKFTMSNLIGTLPDRNERMILAYQRRLRDPQLGDKVEVAWRGKFRLETSDVYQGLAWWVAEVVDKHPSQGRYKIRYPGWESRWDEWVPRDRLRWAVSRNTLVSIQVGDVVELWCCGANVPGAWLESKVKRIRGDRFCLGRVLSTGFLWVERDRIRLVRRASDSYDGALGDQGQSARRSLSGAFSAISQRFGSLRNQSDQAGSCTIM
ncbi:hypothetical protein B484DRAFT_454949 [Ochromonadaceae sp. CCMP2298]|nr:hypothetical protein B484DRAFT_454949 [Ochromonadaceae sp. CCMP2298]